MEPNRQKLGLASLALLLVAGVGGLVLARLTQSFSAHVAVVFAGMGLLVAAVSWFQMRLEERERLEKMEFDELTKSPASSTLFNTGEAESFQARRTREQFEKFFVPGFTVVFLLLQAFACWWVWHWLAKSPGTPMQQPMLIMAVFGLFALLLFMLGKYVSGIVRLENNRLLRPSAGYLLLNAYLCAAVVGAAICAQTEFPRVDLFAARVLCGVLALIAAETLIALVMEIYRPRVKGKEVRLLYDSRLVGLLSQPEGVVTTMAHALDYQFGFKVSETWFYRFLEKALAWIILLQLAILLLSTTFVMIDPGEQALLERFGRPVAGRQLLEPGLHFKMPWPIDKIYRYRTERFQTFTIGIVPEEDEEKEEAILWTVGHAKEEYNLLVASHETLVDTNATSGKKSPPVNLLVVNIPVQFQITNLIAWACNHADAGQLLEKLATREVVRYLVSADINDLMCGGRERAADELRDRIQAAANEHALGTRIAFVGLAGMHPPVGVAGSYEKVVSAMQAKEASILSAKAYAIRTNALAGAAAYRKLQDADSEKRRLEVNSAARAASFTNQIPAFNAEPSVYATRLYLQALVRGVSGPRKYVILTTNTHDVLQFDLQDKLRMDLLDVAPTPTKK